MIEDIVDIVVGRVQNDAKFVFRGIVPAQSVVGGSEQTDAFLVVRVCGVANQSIIVAVIVQINASAVVRVGNVPGESVVSGNVHLETVITV